MHVFHRDCCLDVINLRLSFTSLRLYTFKVLFVYVALLNYICSHHAVFLSMYFLSLTEALNKIKDRIISRFE